MDYHGRDFPRRAGGDQADERQAFGHAESHRGRGGRLGGDDRRHARAQGGALVFPAGGDVFSVHRGVEPHGATAGRGERHLQWPSDFPPAHR